MSRSAGAFNYNEKVTKMELQGAGSTATIYWSAAVTE